MVKQVRLVCERKGATAYSISFLVGVVEDPGFHRIIATTSRARNHFKMRGFRFRHVRESK